MVEAKGRYYTLDGMRGVAALLVAAYHLQQRWHQGSIAGYLAVDLFFALSGFVISLSYTDRLRCGMTAARFLELRLIRLFPLYSLGLFLGIAKLVTGNILHIPIGASVGSPTCAIVFGVAMLPDPCSSQLFPLNGPSWSLFFEVVINTVFAALLWRCSVRVLIAVSVASAMSFPFLISDPHYFNIGWAWVNIAGGATRTIFSFCAGIIIHRIFRDSMRRLSYTALLPIIVTGLIIGLDSNLVHRSFIEISIVVLLFPAIISMACIYEAPSASLRRCFEVFGDLSYPIYAIHWPLIAIIITMVAKFHLPAYLATLLFIVGLMPLAYIAARLDKLVRKRISAALRLRRSANPRAI